MSCKNCIHYEVCEANERLNGIIANLCGLFKDKADFVEVKHGEWTSIKEGLPRSRSKYLCIYVFGESERKYCDVLIFHPEKNAENGYVTGPHFSNEGMNGMRVTHWMPLPKSPRGAE